MSAGAPSSTQIRERVKALREKGKRPGIIGLYSSGAYDGPTSIALDGEAINVVECDSVLGIREVLVERESDTATLVLLTSIPPEELGEDVKARLVGHRLYRVDAWETAMSRFRAHHVDPRLAREGWIADLLLQLPGNGDFPAVPNGYLDSSTAWRVLLGKLLGLTDERPDARGLLRWLVAPGSIERYAGTEPKFRAGFWQLISTTAGEAGTAIGDCIESTRNSDAVAIGLVLDVLTIRAPGVDTPLKMAAARLERMHGNTTLSDRAARAWADASKSLAEEKLGEGASDTVAQWRRRGDEILEEIGAAKYAFLSDFSPRGFSQRLERYGREIQSALDRGDLAALEASAEEVLRHRDAQLTPGAAKRIAMARRLVRWLTARKVPAVEAKSLPDAAQAYAAEGAWVDLARAALRGGESIAILSGAYEMILERARAERERENEAFGRSLVEWNRNPSRSTEIIPVEEVISKVVAPIAESARVLMLVLDGVSLAIFYEFFDSLEKRDWTILTRKANLRKQPSLAIIPGIAAIPTITQISRASLLAGERTRGTSAVERAKFGSNQALLEVSKPKFPPVLFHKGDLTAEGGTELSSVVREAIASPERQIVGVVVNAVDDHLSGPEQVRPEWSLDYFSPHVAALLREAEISGRVVVIGSDHGHVLDADTEARRADLGDRYRSCDTPAGAGELIIGGGRVDGAMGPGLVVPWSERIRYGSRKNGYHGGISPQEVVVPVCVMARAGFSLDGWNKTWIVSPEWWTPQVRQQGVLFAVRATEKQPSFEWIERLLKSRTFKAQKELVGRGAPSDGEVRQTLEVIAALGSKLTLDALGQRLAIPRVRLTARVAAVRRLLNLEGYSVLKHDYDSDTVELDLETLRKQFEL